MKQDSADFCRNAKGSVDQTVLQNSTTGIKNVCDYKQVEGRCRFGWWL